jgi:hypothetical protein
MASPAGTSAHRIRVGLTGLAIAFLLVLLGSVLIRARDSDSPQTVQQVNEGEPSEPLADLGVAPGSEPAANNVADE